MKKIILTLILALIYAPVMAGNIGSGGISLGGGSGSVAVLQTQNWTITTGTWDFTGAGAVTFGPIQFEGATADEFETSFTVTDPTADRTITLGNFDMRIPAAASVDTSGLVVKAGLATDAKFYSFAVATLSDAATPSVLTVAETTNTCISNYKSSGADHVFTFPAPHAAGNVIFIVGDEFQVDLEPVSGDNFYLNGTAMANDEHIQNTSDLIGKRIVGYCANINGTLKWMFWSSDAQWVQETP